MEVFRRIKNKNINNNSLSSLYLQLLVDGLRLCVFAAPLSPVVGTPVSLRGREPKTHQAVHHRLGEQQIFVSNMLAPCQDSLETEKEDSWTDVSREIGRKKKNINDFGWIQFQF